MKWTRKIRHVWHDAFYKNASAKKVAFAMICKDVAGHIDLHDAPATLKDRGRFWLHLSLCQACKNYYDLTNVLHKAIQVDAKKPAAKVDQLNTQLVEKYAKPKAGGRLV